MQASLHYERGGPSFIFEAITYNILHHVTNPFYFMDYYYIFSTIHQKVRSNLCFLKNWKGVYLSTSSSRSFHQKSTTQNFNFGMDTSTLNTFFYENPLHQKQYLKKPYHES